VGGDQRGNQLTVRGYQWWAGPRARRRSGAGASASAMAAGSRTTVVRWTAAAGPEAGTWYARRPAEARVTAHPDHRPDRAATGQRAALRCSSQVRRVRTVTPVEPLVR
jgi:hypothetical protein